MNINDSMPIETYFKYHFPFKTSLNMYETVEEWFGWPIIMLTDPVQFW